MAILIISYDTFDYLKMFRGCLFNKLTFNLVLAPVYRGKVTEIRGATGQLRQQDPIIHSSRGFLSIATNS